MAKDKMRINTRNGRTGKDGTYSSRHNDRNFDISKADHIDPTRTSLNRTYSWDNSPTFEEAELNFYKQHFQKRLDDVNERYIKSGHREDVKFIEDYIKGKNTCPEETLYYIGNKDNHADPDVLWKCVSELIQWEQETFPRVHVLDVALHMDEQGAPHIHERKVWVANENGFEHAKQKLALQQMGIPLPHPEKERGRYNNEKQTFTAQVREHFAEICKSKGLELELTPEGGSRKNLTDIEYKTEQEEIKLMALQERTNQINKMLRSEKETKIQCVDDIEVGIKLLPTIEEQKKAMKILNETMTLGRRMRENEIELQAKADYYNEISNSHPLDKDNLEIGRNSSSELER